MDKYGLEAVYPGLRVISDDVSEDAIDSLECIYDPPWEYECPHCHGLSKRGNITGEPRSIFDIVCEDPVTIVSLHVDRRRHVCSDCGREIPGSSIAPPRNKTTARLDNWIMRQSLSQSPEKVCKMVDGIVTEPQIRKIFNRCADEHLAEYSRELLMPNRLGIHMGLAGKQWFIALSNLDSGELVDVMQEEDSTWSLKLNELAATRLPAECTTSIAYSCLVPARAIFSLVGTTVYASFTSILTEYKRAYLKCVDALGEPKTTEIFYKYLFARPRSNMLYQDTEIRELERRKKAIKKNRTLGMCNQILDTLAAHVTKDNWKDEDLDDLIKLVHRVPELLSYERLVKLSKPEFSAAVAKPLQGEYGRISNKIQKVLDRCSQCDAATTRARLILTFMRNKTTFTDSNGMTKVLFTGVSLDKLVAELPEYTN